MRLSLVTQDEETIEGAGRALREGRTTCVGLVERCLVAIDSWEPIVHAWAVVAADSALRHAGALDRLLAEGSDLGPLHGIPIGVKDIIDVRGLPTNAGAERWSSGPAERDATIVERLKLAGAVVLGKTATTAYAFLDPAPTRNPWNPERTPGGSSSGSAAAVATGMCLAAVGTQTVGSITRPASFCGVSSWKPSRSWGDMMEIEKRRFKGIVPLAPTFDQTGMVARSIGDLAIIESIVERDRWRLAKQEAEGEFATRLTPRIGLLGGPFRERAEPAMLRALDRAAMNWSEAGAEVVRIERLHDGFDAIWGYGRSILASEAAAFHGSRFDSDPGDYPPRIAELIREGRDVRAPDYIKAREFIEGRAGRFPFAGAFDLVVTPAALGPAPGRETTGDAFFNAPWSFLGLPTLSLPIGLSNDGLPLGAQFVSGPDDFPVFFRDVRWCERVVRSSLIATGG